MTTLRDLLNDFAHEVHDNSVEAGELEVRDVEDIVDEYIGLIKERLIG